MSLLGAPLRTRDGIGGGSEGLKTVILTFEHTDQHVDFLALSSKV